jgi:sterol 24-C-methyltransferase
MNTNKDSIFQGEIEIGDGLPDIRLTTKCLEALKQAGFEVSI